MRTPAGLTLGGLLLAAGCSSSTSSYGTGTGGGGCTPTATQVCMVNTTFAPTSLTVASGTTVTWKNADGFDHTTTANPSNPTGCPAWDNTVGAGSTSAGVTFSPPGGTTCLYYCRLHSTATTGPMRASITVQ